MDKEKTNGHKRPTIKEIAKLAGVTPATVSMVINDSGRVGEETRKKVKKIAEELGYRPNVIAQGLVTQRLKLIGMIVPSFHDDFSHDVFLGIEEYAKRLGYKVLVGLTHNQGDLEESLIREFLQLNVAGLIIQPAPSSWQDTPFFQELQQEKIPFVFFTRYPQQGDYERVLCEDALGGELATRHLIERGHTRIAFYTNRIVEKANDSINKREGYRAAMRKAGLEARREWEVSSERFASDEALKQWISEHGITAIFVSTDFTAINLMLRLQEMGYRVPEDIAIVGYDDIRMASMCSPKLTTIQVPKRKIGELAAQKIIPDLQDAHPLPPKQVLVTPQLIIRRST
ncbi:LacI family transcriptional regulator [Brevibacillus sp. SYP-B805]|uniref:LacI family DNA-binding transcriptional regulator n=1 Tax=Brevibacillus sp. SYP-B805 TaxID=1578199 RepID=UPI0013EB2757|nr:LacI family DNA-binding transcriptional regulator [Brevibacillus sp. SYP-B805]NGQ95856.1 LacI family transcriptional regulator [Brevibacillus sp. SYP-B805]